MAKAIMIQGTMSNAGKSLVAAGLCRIFKQDGYRVTPFKSQNMALNSFITKEGLEMGRAQVMQAEAAGAEPSVLMNPILLKPTNDTGSQVIVNGKVRGNMSARDYFRYKKELVPEIMRAYRALDEAYDIIVIEGAGSPAEINLKTDDIVNMGMAKMAGAPVLLVGDIDRGGVFAQLYGTIMLLEDGERDLVKGLVINKFRGDKTILDPGIRMLEDLCNKEVVGVVPYMDVDLEDEDSLSERIDGRKSTGADDEVWPQESEADRSDAGQRKRDEKQKAPIVDMAVIRFPRISNFTDFNIFESIEGVSVRYVKQPSQLKNPDLIFLPGTKNTMRDLLWMRQSGLEAAVLKAKEAGTVIFGICGGYQMLGRSISDPDGVEEGGRIRGMGLLAMDTVFAGEKTRTRVEGTFGRISGVLESLSGTSLSGYEIHMGQSRFAGEPEDTAASCSLADITDRVSGIQKSDGACCGNVYGTYIHGIFDREDVVRRMVLALAARHGIDRNMDENNSGQSEDSVFQFDAMDYTAYKEQQYDKLAEVLRQHLDMERVYEILGIDSKNCK